MRPKPGTGAKPRIVILGGAGAMGRIMVRDLQRTSRGKVRIVVADRDVSAAPGLRVETMQVDVTDSGSLRRVLDGAYATIASLPYRYNLEAMHGALEAGAHYVDLGGLFHMTRRQLKLAPEFERRPDGNPRHGLGARDRERARNARGARP